MKITPKGAFAAIAAFKEAVQGNTVSDTEVSRRLAICARCPMLRNVSGVSGAVSRVLGVVANRHRVPAVFSNRSCGVCGCSLLLLVPAAKEDLHVDSPEESRKRPSKCWMKTL